MLISIFVELEQGVPITRDGLTNELQQEKQPELMTDSYISQSRHVDVGRELEPWIPDENDPGCPELENIFDGPWNRFAFILFSEFWVNFMIVSSLHDQYVRNPPFVELYDMGDFIPFIFSVGVNHLLVGQMIFYAP